MANPIDAIRSFLRKPKASVDQLAANLDLARRAEAAALGEVERHVKLVADGFLDDDAVRAKARTALAAARDTAEDAGAVRSEVERRHAAALAVDEDGRRRVVYEAAREKVDAVKTTLEKRYGAIVADTLRLLCEIAEAEEAAEQANATLPAGVMPLGSAEMATRGSPFLPALPDEVEIIECWAFDDGQMVPEEYEDHVVAYGRDQGSYKTNRTEGIDNVEVGQPVTRRQFRRVTSYPAHGGSFPLPFVTQIRLPALYGEYLVWGSAFGFFSAHPEGTVAALAEAEAMHAAAAKPVLPTKTQRPKKVEMHPIWTPAEIAKADSPATDFHDRVQRPAQTGRFSASPFARSAPARAGGRR